MIMRRIFGMVALIAAVFLTSPTNAADIPLKVLRYAAPPAPQWTGWNFGISLGARFADVTGTTLSFDGGAPPFPVTAVQGYDSTAFRYGGYLGYDWQFAPQWLAGLEGDFAWGDAKKRVNALQGITLPTDTGNFSEVRQTWDAGLRARFGYLLDPTLLLYVTGGVQWQHFEATVNCSANTCGPTITPPGLPYLQTNSTTRTGGTIGGGIEKMLANRWLIRTEYRYADYGTWTNSFGGTPAIVKAFDLATHTGFLGVAKKF